MTRTKSIVSCNHDKEMAWLQKVLAKEIRGNMRWWSAGQHRWYTDTPLGEAYCVRQAEHKWVWGFAAQACKGKLAASMAKARDMLAQHIAQHQIEHDMA